jgi:anti-sigma factor RsiW
VNSHVEVGAYAIGSLSADDAEDFEGHLDRCPTCPAELEWLAQVVRLMTTVTYSDVMLAEAS